MEVWSHQDVRRVVTDFRAASNRVPETEAVVALLLFQFLDVPRHIAVDLADPFLGWRVKVGQADLVIIDQVNADRGGRAEDRLFPVKETVVWVKQVDLVDPLVEVLLFLALE